MLFRSGSTPPNAGSTQTRGALIGVPIVRRGAERFGAQQNDDGAGEKNQKISLPIICQRFVFAEFVDRGIIIHGFVSSSELRLAFYVTKVCHENLLNNIC